MEQHYANTLQTNQIKLLIRLREEKDFKEHDGGTL